MASEIDQSITEDSLHTANTENSTTTIQIRKKTSPIHEHTRTPAADELGQ